MKPGDRVKIINIRGCPESSLIGKTGKIIKNANFHDDIGQGWMVALDEKQVVNEDIYDELFFDYELFILEYQDPETICRGED